MKKNSTIVLMAVLLMAGATSLFAEWWLETPDFYQAQGGAARLGPYATREQAETVNNGNFSGRGTITGSDASGGSGAAGGGANNIATQAAGQIGSAVGNAIGKAMSNALFGDPQAQRNEALNLNNQGIQYYNQGQWEAATKCFQAAIAKAPDDPVIWQNFRNANGAWTQQQQAAEAKVRQENHDRLASQLKLSDGTEGSASLNLKDMKTGEGGGLGLKDLKTGDNETGHVGVRGLPGIYLNNTPGKASDNAFGIPGLPGTYVNGPASPSPLTQPNKAAPRNAAIDNRKQTTAVNDADKTLHNDKAAKGTALIDSAVKGPVPAPAEAGKNPAAVGENGTPPGQTETQAPKLPAAAPAALQHQAKASQTAVNAQTPEEAATQAGAGFDTPLPPANANNPAPLVHSPNVNSVSSTQSGIAPGGTVAPVTNAPSVNHYTPTVARPASPASATANTPAGDPKASRNDSAWAAYNDSLKQAFFLNELRKKETDDLGGFFASSSQGKGSAVAEVARMISMRCRDIHDEWEQAHPAPPPTLKERAKEFEAAHDRIRKKELAMFDTITNRRIHDVGEEINTLRKQGILKPDETVDQKRKSDPEFRKTLEEIDTRFHRSIAADMSAADREAQAELQSEFRRIMAK